MEQEMESGQAKIERGRVIKADPAGYTVASLDRDGIVSLPIGTVAEEKYIEGDRVYFFLFRDGTGKILCGM